MMQLRLQQGFTLMEVIVAVTVLAIIMTTLYMALSTSTRLWTRQQDGLSPTRRLETVVRLLREDLSGIRPYEFQWERGRDFFFSGSPKLIFYVTDHGLGASERRENGLYFACLLLRPSEDGEGEELWLIKNAHPTEELAEALHEFAVESTSERQSFDLGRELQGRSHLLLSGLSEARFSYDRGSAESARTPGRSTEEEALPIEDWRSKNLPQRVRFHFTWQEALYSIDAFVAVREGT